MKIICLVKFVPNLAKTGKVEIDQESGNIQREKSKLIINPDDASALALALKLKKEYSHLLVEVLSMGPMTIIDDLKNLIRLGVDKATLISDRAFQGSDSYATSLILSTYLKTVDFNCVFTGTQTIDGGTGHIGPQIAESLQINQFSEIIEVEELKAEAVIVKAVLDDKLLTLQMSNPSVLSMNVDSRRKLGFVAYDNQSLNVDSQFEVLSHTDLDVLLDKVGRRGSPTIVRKDLAVQKIKKEKQIFKLNDEGIERVYQFLKEQGYV